MGRKVGMRSCKALREAKVLGWVFKGLTAADLTLLGTLGSVLPALERLFLVEPAAGPDARRRAAAGGETGRGRAAGRDRARYQRYAFKYVAKGVPSQKQLLQLSNLHMMCICGHVHLSTWRAALLVHDA